MAVSGYSAANTVPTSKGGDGAGTISGYTISTVKYTLNSTDPRNIDTVTFNTDMAPPCGATVKVRRVSSCSTWYSCTFAATAVTCTTTSPAATVATADELRVVIAQSEGCREPDHAPP